jgi:Bacterial Ig-like domain (group 3)
VGDANLAASSASVNQTVDRYATNTALSSSMNPANLNQLVTFTATVTASDGVPTGTVTFSKDGVAMATVTLSGGQATYSQAFGTTGTKTFTASYSGDNNNKPSTSAPLNEVVN